MKHTTLLVAALFACTGATAVQAKERVSREEAIVGAFQDICLEAKTSEASRQAVEAMKGVLVPSVADSVFGDRYTYRLRISRVEVRAVVFRDRCDFFLERMDIPALSTAFGAMLETLPEGVEALKKISPPDTAHPTLGRPQYQYVRWQPAAHERAATLEMSAYPKLGRGEKEVNLYRGWRNEAPAETTPPTQP